MEGYMSNKIESAGKTAKELKVIATQLGMEFKKNWTAKQMSKALAEFSVEGDDVITEQDLIAMEQAQREAELLPIEDALAIAEDLHEKFIAEGKDLYTPQNEAIFIPTGKIYLGKDSKGNKIFK